MPRASEYPLAQQFAQLDVPWPNWAQDFAGRDGSRKLYKAAQDKYYEQMRLPQEPATLDEWRGGRAKAWKTLWHRRDRLEDTQQVVEGVETKLAERQMERLKKKNKRQRITSMVTNHYLPNPDDVLLDQVPEEREGQLAALALFERVGFREPPAPTCTWNAKADETAVTLVADWFSAVQQTRSVKHHQVALGQVLVTGYQGYPGMAQPDHNQKLVTISISHGEELRAALEHVAGLACLVNAMERYVQCLAHCPLLRVCRLHFLDQSGQPQFKARAEKQAGFKWHNDKGEEVDRKQADATTGYRNISVLFTAVIRLGGTCPSALQVLGYPSAPLHELGDVQIFPSILTHATSVLGGQKVALFIGMPHPLVGEQRLQRYRL
jgi:hypothetical protein